MRTPLRHAALLLAAALLALTAALATAGAALGPATTVALPDTGIVPEGRLDTPAPQPLCAERAQLAPARRTGEPGGSAAPSLPRPVPILAYHYVRTDRTAGDVLGNRLSVTPSDFAAQMDLLRRDGVHAITLGDLLAALHGDASLPSRPVVITFDDGYDNLFFNALPVLQRYHLCATVFAIPGFLGRPGYLTATRLRAVAAAGVRIGAHTMTHVDLTKQPPDALAAEIGQSGDALRALTGQEVADFAYPFGSFDDAAMHAVQAAGFSDAVALQNGLPESWTARYALPRIEVVGGESLVQFAADAGLPPPGQG